MAPYFASVLAVDLETEMISVGEREAGVRGVTNIAWRVEQVEELQLGRHSFELITIGEAFHRLDQKRVLTQAMQWLQPRGSLATLGAEPVWRGEEAWKRVLVDVVNKWTGRSLGAPNTNKWGGPSDALCEVGLKVEEHEHVVEWVWTCESIIGFMFSTSVASRRVLGNKAGRFEADLRAELLDCEPNGRFVCAQRFGFTLGMKEGDDR